MGTRILQITCQKPSIKVSRETRKERKETKWPERGARSSPPPLFSLDHAASLGPSGINRFPPDFSGKRGRCMLLPSATTTATVESARRRLCSGLTERPLERGRRRRQRRPRRRRKKRKKRKAVLGRLRQKLRRRRRCTSGD